MIRALLIACATLIIAHTAFAQGIPDRWTEAGLIKEFFMTYKVKTIREGPFIKSIVLDRKGHHSGNAWFHGGECYCLVMQVARGPEKPVNFDTDISTEGNSTWIDKVTGNKIIGNEDLDDWRFEAVDSSGTPILTASLEAGNRFVLTEVTKP